MDLAGVSIKLDQSVGTPEPCPNWRQVPGFPVFGCGQPTEEGFTKIAELIPKGQTIWFNLRREPVAYIAGQPVSPRNPDSLHENIDVASADIQPLEVKFVTEIKSQVKDGNIEVHKDKNHAENPMDRVDETQTIKAEGVKGLNEVLKGLSEAKMPGTTVVGVPFIEQKGVPEEGFDIIVKALSGANAATTQCVFSSQLGQGRSTLGMVAASIIKAKQMITKLNMMVDEGMAQRAWADNIIKSKFEDSIDSEDNKDPFKRGEFDVIKELLESFPESKAGKAFADKMIDICGVPPEGTGMQNLRKAVIEKKYKYDASTEDKQVYWKTMIINFLERYFYIICFATYVREQEPLDFPKTFVSWMDDHSHLREMIEQGKDKLEWTRKVDQSKVDNLKNMINESDYKEKLGGMVSQLYKIAFETYKDIPRGPIKDNLMRKLACKTLMEILPQEVHTRVQQELVEKKLSVDFDTIVGLVVG